ncbi:MAG: F0F1 ATP synthase subunit delta [Defluviitaleaceae bacterium]|nr:F0F1 ATP synthase subunit delta [Defluviitaleaceae bacterium]
MKKVAQSYAAALYSAATEMGCAEDIADELTAAENLLNECSGYLYSPLHPWRKKAALLREFLTGHFNPLTIEFMILMLSRRQIKSLPEAASCYRLLSGLADTVVRLRVPYEPDELLLKKFRTYFADSKLLSKDKAESAVIEIELDKDLIGGYVAYCNGQQIDASLKTALAKIGKLQTY